MEKRRPNRLSGYDYAQAGAYFITVCTRGREPVFWCAPDAVGAHSVRPPRPEPPLPELSAEIGQAPLPAGAVFSSEGQAVVAAIGEIPRRYPMVTVDASAVMPNHVHLLLQIHGGNDGAIGRTMCAPTVSRVVKHWKEAVTKRIHRTVWQRSFHDHIIRNEPEYRLVGAYILSNPVRWQQDRFHPPAPSAKEIYP